jgi:hypothetical protein
MKPEDDTSGRRLGRQGVVTHAVSPEDGVQSTASDELAHAENSSMSL